MSFQILNIGIQAKSFEDAISLLRLPKNSKYVRMEQVHGNKITEITNLSQNASVVNFPGVDACYTSEKNTYLSVKSADCLPILIHGTNTQSGTQFTAAAHAGRKGTKKKILAKLLDQVNNKYGFTKDTTLHLWFGPAICYNCYQIDEKTNLHFNLIEENQKQLEEYVNNNDLKKDNIKLEIVDSCTLHQNDKFYSYRATGPGVKMNYSFIYLT